MNEVKMSLLGPLEQGWDRMVQMLFRPFDLGRWLVIGFAAWLAGLAGGGSNSGLSWTAENDRPNVVQTAHQSWDWLLSRGIAAGLIVLGILVVLTIIVMVLWISSRGKFIFLDNVVHKRAAIVEPWKRLSSLGNSLFAFRLLVVFLLFPLALGLLFFCFLKVYELGGWHQLEGLPLVVGVATAAGFGFFLLMTTLYAAFFLEAFVVPLMHRFHLGVIAAWMKFLNLFSLRPGWFFLCGLFVFGLYAVTAVAVLFAGLMTCCFGFLLLALPYIGTVVALPLLITYRAFTVQFLAQLEPALRLENH